MQLKRLNIAIIILIGIFSFQAIYVFAEQPKGSRLYIKPVAKTKTLHFTKGKSVLPFKPTEGNFDLKLAKTVNLYYANYLLNRNLSKPVVKESSIKPAIVTENLVIPVKAVSTASSDEAMEPGDRFYTNDGLTISNIFPNPADDAGNFEYSFTGNNFKEVKIDFFNVLGSPMNVTIFLEKFERKARVNLKEFPNGFYFYQLIADGKTLATKKLLVRHN